MVEMYGCDRTGNTPPTVAPLTEAELTKVKDVLAADAAAVETFLRNRIARTPALSDMQTPALKRLWEAQQYSLLAGGKRIRPVLAMECCRMLGGKPEAALYPAAALEMVHTYSLIHDDMPCMDNDDLRRGKPTCHKVFGEAVALQAGDGLLTDALYMTASVPGVDDTCRTALCRTLALAAGSVGMVGGQVMDKESENADCRLTRADLALLQARKTGALFRASVEIGALTAGIYPDEDPDSVWQRLQVYADRVGKAFQMADDLLDVFSNPAELGKSVGKDAAEHKFTILSFLSPEEARAEMRNLTGQACDAIGLLPESTFLCHLARMLSDRIG